MFRLTAPALGFLAGFSNAAMAGDASLIPPFRYWFGDKFASQTIEKIDLNSPRYQGYHRLPAEGIGTYFNAFNDRVVFAVPKTLFTEDFNETAAGLVMYHSPEDEEKSECLHVAETAAIEPILPNIKHMRAIIYMTEGELERVRETGCLAFANRRGGPEI